MEELSRYLFFPFLVGIVGGLTIYLIRVRIQGRVVEQILVSEINLLLRQAKDCYEYLKKEDHPWLILNKVLDDCPVYVSNKCDVFRSLVPQLYLLPYKKISKALEFYSHHGSCENLLEILFLRLQQYEKSKTKLDKRKIHITDIRRKRVIKGYDSLLRVTNLEIKKLTDLPDSYHIPAAVEISVTLPTKKPVKKKSKKSKPHHQTPPVEAAK